MPAAKSLPATPGWCYASDEDGQLSVEMDAPYEGTVTLTWNPSAAFAPKGKQIEHVIPTVLFEKVLHSYTVNRLPKK